jgi:hypothetical protein
VVPGDLWAAAMPNAAENRDRDGACAKELTHDCLLKN